MKAESVVTREETDGLFTEGNLVESKGLIILVAGNGIDDGEFSGQVVASGLAGDYSNTWVRSAFKQFRGTVTLSV